MFVCLFILINLFPCFSLIARRMKKEKPVVTTLKKSKTAKFGKNGKLFVL